MMYFCKEGILNISELFPLLCFTMMASVDAEAEIENLFGDDEAQEGGTQSLTQEEGEFSKSGWNKIEKIKNPFCRGAKSCRPV